MPVLNALGEALMGEGGFPTSIDGAVVPELDGFPAGQWAWLSETVIVGKADFGGGYNVYTIDLDTSVVTQIIAGESAATRAGGGIYQMYFAPGGITTNAGSLGTLPNAGPGDVAVDGWSAMVPAFASDFGIDVYDETGTLQTTISTQLFPSNAIKLRDEILSYPDVDLAWHLLDRATGLPISFAQRTAIQSVLVPVTVDDHVYVVERDVTTPAEQITLRLATNSKGFVVQNAGLRYGVDAIWMAGTTTVRIAYSTGASELPSELVVHDIDVVTGAHSIAVVVGSALVWTAQPNLTNTPLPASGASGSGTSALTQFENSIYTQSVIDKRTGLMTRPWYLFIQALIQEVTNPIQAGQIQGILQQQNGGTGTTTGLTNLPNAAPLDATYLTATDETTDLASSRQLLAGIGIDLDASVAGEMTVSATYEGQWIPLVDGSEPPNLVSDGAGALILVAYGG